jgi:ketosteroid isomerase-like protein
MADGDTLLAVGEAGGTISGQFWRIPAAWMAVIREGVIVEWRVFADNKPVYEILQRRRCDIHLSGYAATGACVPFPPAG